MVTAELAALRHDEGVRLDPDCLAELYADLGEHRAERVFGTAVEDISARLGDLERAAQLRDVAGLVRAADRLAHVARQVGMTSVVRVAGDVLIAARAGDVAAIGATAARLARIGDRSLAAVWDIRDISL
jgi:hypothetical protein